ncbi:MAG TPA: CocE/NonD family hydrolase [Solirubrobacteraceae bacterium]|jgi:putative CocE/NonD family hydrolase
MGGRTCAAVLAGVALAAGAAPASAAEVETLPFEAIADDGATLRGHVFLPKQAPRPLGTVLSFSPYFYGAGAEFEGTDEQADNDEVAFLLDAGFAYAAVNLRGTGHSDGCMRFGDERDWRDAATVIQAIAAQPWSNGSVGMYGHSFPAWSQMMAMAADPPALKAIVPTSGAFDLWSLLMRRGAPLNAEGSTAFGPIFTAVTRPTDEAVANHICPELLDWYQSFSENSNSGDRTDFYRARDLRERVSGSRVPMMGSLGIISGINDGHTLQFEGMWDRLRHDRTRFVLGQWSHEIPTSHKEDWRSQVVGWFDHYLRGGPETVPGGVVEYQDDAFDWHVTDRWPPLARTQTLQLSGDEVVPQGERAEPVDASFQSADNDPGLRTDQPDEQTRLYNSTCGPHQALFVSRPLAEDALLAGNFDLDLELSSTLPGGNLSVFLWRTTGDGSCPDQTATWFGRALMDLRHWETPGESRDFPVGEPTHVRFRSHPFAARVRKGERIVVAVGGGSSEIEPDPRHPVITITGGSLALPVPTTAGESPAGGGGSPPGAEAGPPLRFEPPAPSARRRCASRRRFPIRLRRSFARARVTVGGRRVRVSRRRGRLRAVVDLRGMPRRTVRVRIVGVTRGGRRIVATRSYRPCAKKRRTSRRWQRS